MSSSDRPQRDDLTAHDYVMGLPIRDVVRELVDVLGATTVAVIGGVKETRAVQQWTVDREPQRAHVLRFALQVALMLVDGSDDYEAVRAWFHGANPRLDDAIPILLLRDEALGSVQRPLLEAARAFARRPAVGEERHPG